MSVSPEDFIEWTQPTDAQLVGYVDSPEALAEAHQWVADERQAWLVNLFKNRIAEETEGAPPAKEVDFGNIALQSVLTYDQHQTLVDEGRVDWKYPFSTNEQYRAWRVMADFEAQRQGFYPANSKYYGVPSNERSLDRLLEKSHVITDSHFPIRLIMNGVPHTFRGALDLQTVQEWLATRDDHGDYPPVFHTPQGYWPKIIEAKQQWDDEKNHSVYADVVETIGDRVYTAPYVPDELMKGTQFVTYDSVARTLARLGELGKPSVQKLFRNLLRSSTDDIDSLQQIDSLTQYKGQSHVGSGVIFFDRERLPDILENLATNESISENQHHLASYVLAMHFPELVVSEEDRRYEAMVFGRITQEENPVVSYRTKATMNSSAISVFSPHFVPSDETIIEDQPEEIPKTELDAASVYVPDWQDRPINSDKAIIRILLEAHRKLLDVRDEYKEGLLQDVYKYIDESRDARVEATREKYRAESAELDLGYAQKELEKMRGQITYLLKSLAKYVSSDELLAIKALLGISR